MKPVKSIFYAKHDEALDALSDEDLETLKQATLKMLEPGAAEVLAKSSPKTNRALRSLMFDRLATARPSAAEPEPVQVYVANVAADFDEEPV